MADISKEQVVDYLSNLPVIQIAELVSELEEKWGVSAAPVAVAGGGAAGVGSGSMSLLHHEPSCSQPVGEQAVHPRAC